jgi:hypothetical protein
MANLLAPAETFASPLPHRKDAGDKPAFLETPN